MELNWQRTHMLKYSKTLANEIQQLESDLKEHNDKVQKFYQSIDPTTADCFMISSTALDKKSHEYNSKHIHDLVISVWDENIKNILGVRI
jgi:hypothetical protein